MKRLILKESSRIYILHLSEILFIEAANRKVKIAFRDGSEIYISYPLKEISKKLAENESFLQSHRSYIVNINHIQEIAKNSNVSYEAVGENFNIPISRNYFKSFIKIMEERIK